jgi:hypothetical protein
MIAPFLVLTDNQSSAIRDGESFASNLTPNPSPTRSNCRLVKASGAGEGLQHESVGVATF